MIALAMSSAEKSSPRVISSTRMPTPGGEGSRFVSLSSSKVWRIMGSRGWLSRSASVWASSRAQLAQRVLDARQILGGAAEEAAADLRIAAACLAFQLQADGGEAQRADVGTGRLERVRGALDQLPVAAGERLLDLGHALRGGR